MNKTFEEFAFDEKILKGIQDARFEFCMPVQAKCFEEVIGNGYDVTVQSQTGTGKTAAFLLSIFQLFAADRITRKKALIIVPTRELAVQVEDEAILLGKYLDWKIGSFYGGIGYNKQEQLIRQGVDIVIGTPGRLIDFGKRGMIDFQGFGAVVIDEADRLFDMGFLPDLRRMIRMLCPMEERKTMLFSATLSTRVQHLAWEYMKEPINIEIEPENITVDEISQSLYHVSKGEKFRLLLGILAKEEPRTAIIFANTKHMVVELAKRLEVNGVRCEFIMGDLPQKKRLQIIDQLKKGELHFLVATDVAARGLHIDDLAMVINYDVPEDPENYVHRIGRTARAGKSGRAVTFACESYVFGLEAIEALINMKIPVEWADDSLYGEDKSKGMSFRHEYDRQFDRRSGTSRGRNGHRHPRERSDSRQGRRSPRSEASTSRTRRSERGGGQTGGSRRRDSSGKSAPRGKSQGRQPDRSHQRKREQPPKELQQKRQHGGGRRRPEKGKRESQNRKKNLQSRVEYYREKYGDDFKITEEMVQNEKKTEAKKGFWQRLLGVFRKKK